MGEPEAHRIIAKGSAIIEDTEMFILKHPKGHCDGCAYLEREHCPSKARMVCCTGGYVWMDKETFDKRTKPL